MYRRYAAAFLAECAGTPTPAWSRPHRADDRGVRAGPGKAGFVSRPAAARPRPPVRFFAFLAAHGVVPAGIAGAVPTIREWKHARLAPRPSPPLGLRTQRFKADSSLLAFLASL